MQLELDRLFLGVAKTRASLMVSSPIPIESCCSYLPVFGWILDALTPCEIDFLCLPFPPPPFWGVVIRSVCASGRRRQLNCRGCGDLPGILSLFACLQHSPPKAFEFRIEEEGREMPVSGRPLAVSGLPNLLRPALIHYRVWCVEFS